MVAVRVDVVVHRREVLMLVCVERAAHRIDGELRLIHRVRKTAPLLRDRFHLQSGRLVRGHPAAPRSNEIGAHPTELVALQVVVKLGERTAPGATLGRPLRDHADVR